MKKNTIIILLSLFPVVSFATTYSVCTRLVYFNHIYIASSCDIKTFEEFTKTTDYKAMVTCQKYIQVNYPKINYMIQIISFPDSLMTKEESVVLYDNYNYHIENFSNEEEFEIKSMIKPEIRIIALENDMETLQKLLDYGIRRREVVATKITEAIQQNRIDDFDTDVLYISEEKIVAILNAPNKRVAKFLRKYPSLEQIEKDKKIKKMLEQIIK